MAISKEFEFITSSRFWALVLAGLAVWLRADGYVTPAFADFIVTVAGGFIGINSYDRLVKALHS